MAIVQNKSSEIGDVILIQSNVPIIGVIALLGFMDSTVNEGAYKYFYKEFRYSLDGINFYPWVELTNPNISAISFTSTTVFTIEYRYTRIGTDPTGELEFNEVTLDSEINFTGCGRGFINSIFSQFFSCSDVNVLGWALNVLEKLYKKGLLPTFIERGENNNILNEDEDFLAYWYTQTHFFALFVYYARKYKEIESIPFLFKEYIRQKGLLFIPGEANQGVLEQWKQYFYAQVALRGTQGIYKYSYNSGGGELLNLIGKKELDEFIYCLTETWKTGWNLGNSSPIYKGNFQEAMMIKGYETSKDFINLFNYPTQGGISIITDGSKEVAEIIDSGDSVRNGLSSVTVGGYQIIVDPNIDYEITFDIKMIGSSCSLWFDCRAFNSQNIAQGLLNIENNAIRNYFFQGETLLQPDIYYTIRGIIYNQNHPIISTTFKRLNIGFPASRNLKFYLGNNTTSIKPQIYLKGGTLGDTVYIWNYKIRPLNTPHSKGLINSNNLITTWMKNNNQQKSVNELEDIIIEKLNPYNSKMKTIWL